MHYEINVSLNGRHFFATAKQSITCVHDLRQVLPVISAKFPKSEGFELMVSKRYEGGEYLSPVQLMELGIVDSTGIKTPG